jgi:hypothetical protein
MVILKFENRHVRLAYQAPASSTFLSEKINHQQSASSTLFSTNQHQPSATSQTNRQYQTDTRDGVSVIPSITRINKVFPKKKKNKQGQNNNVLLKKNT